MDYLDYTTVELIDEFISTLSRWDRYEAYYLGTLLPQVISGEIERGSAVSGIASALRKRLRSDELGRLSQLVMERRAGRPIEIESDIEWKRERELDRRREVERLERERKEAADRPRREAELRKRQAERLEREREAVVRRRWEEERHRKAAPTPVPVGGQRRSQAREVGSLVYHVTAVGNLATIERTGGVLPRAELKRRGIAFVDIAATDIINSPLHLGGAMPRTAVSQ